MVSIFRESSNSTIVIFILPTRIVSIFGIIGLAFPTYVLYFFLSIHLIPFVAIHFLCFPLQLFPCVLFS